MASDQDTTLDDVVNALTRLSGDLGRLQESVEELKEQLAKDAGAIHRELDHLTETVGQMIEP